MSGLLSVAPLPITSMTLASDADSDREAWSSALGLVACIRRLGGIVRGLAVLHPHLDQLVGKPFLLSRQAGHYLDVGGGRA